MMRDTYSLYEAKARLSAIVKMVREGRHVVVTVHGKPVVEMRPIEEKHRGLRARMEALAERGILVRPESPRKPPATLARRQGALKRFLESRD